MADRPKIVSYKWTPIDRRIAHGDVSEGAYVTPYQIRPQHVNAAASHAVGAMVPIPLSASASPGRVERFFPDDKEFTWERIPDSISRSCTIAELCAALFAHNPNKYVAAYYDFTNKSDSSKNEAAALIFDYWGNTELRYAVVSAPDFRPSSLSRQTAAMPAEKDGRRALYALVKRPVVIPVRAAPGKQVVRPADPGLELMNADIFEIARRARRVRDLLTQSEAIMKKRVLFAADIAALRAVFQASATSSSGATLEASLLAAKAAGLEPILREAMLKKPIPELFPGGKSALMTPALEAILREKLGYTSDIGAEVQRLSDELRDRLLGDKEIADRCATWAKHALKHDLQSTAAFTSKCDRLVAAVRDALDVLAETQSGRALSDRLWKIIDARPASAARSAADIGGETTLGVVFSLVGAGAKAAPAFIGNFAGPPSLSIAAIQAAAASSFVEAASRAAKGDQAGLSTMIERIFGALEGTIDADSELYQKLRAARAANDGGASLFNLRHEVASAVGGKHQTSLGWRSGVVLLQLLNLAMSVSSFVQKRNAHSLDSSAPPPSLYDYLDVLGQVGPCAAGVTETLIQAFGDVEKAAAGLKTLGLAVGRLSAIIGLASGVVDLAASFTATDHRALKQITATTGILGNLFMLTGLLPFVTPVPFLQYAGAILLAANIVLTAATQLSSSTGPARLLGTNIVARGVVQSMRQNPFYDLLALDPAIEPRLRELAEGAQGAILPYARNTALVIDMLRHAGFTPKERAMIVNTDAPPPALSIENLLVQGL